MCWCLLSLSHSLCSQRIFSGSDVRLIFNNLVRKTKLLSCENISTVMYLFLFLSWREIYTHLYRCTYTHIFLIHCIFLWGETFCFRRVKWKCLAFFLFFCVKGTGKLAIPGQLLMMETSSLLVPVWQSDVCLRKLGATIEKGAAWQTTPFPETQRF